MLCSNCKEPMECTDLWEGIEKSSRNIGALYECVLCGYSAHWERTARPSKRTRPSWKTDYDPFNDIGQIILTSRREDDENAGNFLVNDVLGERAVIKQALMIRAELVFAELSRCLVEQNNRRFPSEKVLIAITKKIVNQAKTLKEAIMMAHDYYRSSVDDRGEISFCNDF